MKNKIKNFIHKYRHDFALALILLLIISISFLLKDRVDVFSEREAFENFINSFGFWAPIIVIFSIIVEVVAAPIPGFIIATASGFVFGPIEGAIYVYIGNVVGSLIVFVIARRLGRKIIERLFKKNLVEKYEKSIEKHENWLLFFYFLPILPIDIITAAFGLSGISFKKFFVVISLGYIFYSLIMTNFGDYLAKIWF